ncbi:MAG: hypothetical protein A2096_15210 [Spirochaetes bacterium GWF1_41_5]|nr:MAG: hypothetical protein A2096_15210 [Spirochaetes bacterium GWF1_41_5]HBE03259.1 hypothetical protein [Spirochaetia bacterium]
MRRAFSDTLLKIAEKNDKIVFLTGDLGYKVFDDFIAKFPGRYINTGVAEAQLINTAVGLALEGYRPIAYSIAPFATARPFEQIRFGVAYHKLPVMIVGAGGGFTYAKSGVTHHAPDDLALLGILPDMTIVSPGGPDELRMLMPELLKLKGPSYLRVGKYGEPELNHPSPVELGKGRCLRAGKRIAIITSGDIVCDIYPKMNIFLSAGLDPALYHFHTIKPVDRSIFPEIEKNCSTAVIVEESIPQGGIYREICEWKAETNSKLKILRSGAPDAFILGSPSREELRTRLGLTAAALKDLCLQEFRIAK